MKTTPSVAAAFHKAPNEDPGSAQAARRQPGFPQGSGTRGAERGALWTRAPRHQLGVPVRDVPGG